MFIVLTQHLQGGVPLASQLYEKYLRVGLFWEMYCASLAGRYDETNLVTPP